VINLDITLEETVEEMIISLKYEALDNDVKEEDIRILFADKDINSLDDLFLDGGEIRCEHFSDLAWDYAFQFGTLESEGFSNAHWEALELAMKRF
jgi:hypothetical protein